MSARKKSKPHKKIRTGHILIQQEAYIKKLDERLYGIFLDDGSLIGISTDYFAAKIKIKEENMKLVSLQ